MAYGLPSNAVSAWSDIPAADLSKNWGAGTPSSTPQPASQPGYDPSAYGITPGGGAKQPQTPTSGNWGGDWNTGGELSGPGTGEQWYTSHASQFDQPTNSQNYWNAVQGKVLGGPNETNWTEQMLGTMPSQTSAASQTSTMGSPYSLGMNTNFGPTAASGLSTSFGPTAASGMSMNWGPNAASRLDTSLAPRAADSLSMYFDPTSASHLSTTLGNGVSSGAYGTSSGELANPSVLESGYGQGAFTRDTSYSLPQLQGKSYMEQLADNPQMGFDQYYDRSQEVAQEALDKQHAARGIWNSGAATDEDRQMLADLNAKRALDKTNWIQSTAQGADASKMARLGQEENVQAGVASDRLAGAKGAVDALLGRVGARTQAASAADAAKLGLLGEESKRAGLQDAASMAQAAELRNRAGLKDSDLMAALGEQRARAGLQDQSSEADRQEQRLRASTMDTDAMAQAAESRLRAGLQDQSSLNLLQEERARLGQMDASSLANANYNLNRANNIDQYGINRGQLGEQFGQAMDQNAQNWSTQNLNYLLGGNTMAQGADTSNRALLGMGQDAAYRSQDALQNREQTALNNMLGVSGTEGGVLGDTVNSGASSQRSYTDDFINSLLGIGTGGQNAANDKNAQGTADVGLLVQLANLLKGGGGGGSAGGTGGGGDGYMTPSWI